MDRKKVLIAGASGVVGYAAAKHFAQQPDWEVVGVSRRAPRPVDGVEHLPVDLADREGCHKVFSDLGDVTHVVYAALFEKPGLIPGWLERDQMERNQAMLANLLDPLEAAAGALAHVSLLQGTKAYGVHVAQMRVPAREREARHRHENFYWLQEDYLRALQAGKDWGWTILRPQVIYGDALGSNMNPIPAIGVYAALQRRAGLPFDYPGGPPLVMEAVDADLLARALHWAAEAPVARNETYNITNGDVCVLKNEWPVLAEAFGMEMGSDVPRSLAETMPAQEAAWGEVVERFGLRAPVSLDEFVGQSFFYLDFLLCHGLAESPLPALVSTVKLRQAGFHDCVDTQDMLRRWVARMQEDRLLPPVDW